MKKREKKCNHKLSDKDNTLKKINKVMMVHPRVDTYICEICHKYFDVTEED